MNGLSAIVEALAKEVLLPLLPNFVFHDMTDEDFVLRAPRRKGGNMFVRVAYGATDLSLSGAVGISDNFPLRREVLGEITYGELIGDPTHKWSVAPPLEAGLVEDLVRWSQGDAPPKDVADRFRSALTEIGTAASRVLIPRLESM